MYAIWIVLRSKWLISCDTDPLIKWNVNCTFLFVKKYYSRQLKLRLYVIYAHFLNARVQLQIYFGKWYVQNCSVGIAKITLWYPILNYGTWINQIALLLILTTKYSVVKVGRVEITVSHIWHSSNHLLERSRM